MMKFKLSVSKGKKKYTIYTTGENEVSVREKVHKEGYFILDIKEVSQIEIDGTKFYFEGKHNGDYKTGSIVGSDIFKVYLKLRKDLHYKVLALYKEEDRLQDDIYKAEQIKILEEQFDAYLKATGEVEDVKEIEQIKQDRGISEFYMKAQLDTTNELITNVLDKIKHITDNKDKYNVDFYELEKLKEIYNRIISVRKSTNMGKLKQIGEMALIKVGTIQLKYFEEERSKESKALLAETNKLLKSLGSKEQVIEKNKDLGFLVKNFFSEIGVFLNSFFEKKSQSDVEEENKEKASYEFLKSVILLDKYKKKNKENAKDVFSHFLYFLIPFGKFKEKKEHLLVRKKVISQNIAILEAKVEGRTYSQISKVNRFNAFYKLKRKAKSFVSFSGVFFVTFFIIFAIALGFHKLGVNSLIFSYGAIYFAIIFILLNIVILLSKRLQIFLPLFVLFNFLIIFFSVNF